MRGIGRIIRCMEEEFLNGRMVGFMMEIMHTIRNTVLVEFVGLMVESMRGNGKTDLSMVRASIREEMEFGSKGAGSLGRG
jgi:hypothetical protein